MVRAKFTCVGINRSVSGGQEMQTINLAPVMSGSDENRSFWKWTPSGRIELGTVNVEAGNYFKLGGEYYIDFTEAKAAVPGPPSPPEGAGRNEVA